MTVGNHETPPLGANDYLQFIGSAGKSKCSSLASVARQSLAVGLAPAEQSLGTRENYRIGTDTSSRRRATASSYHSILSLAAERKDVLSTQSSMVQFSHDPLHFHNLESPGAESEVGI